MVGDWYMWPRCQRWESVKLTVGWQSPMEVMSEYTPQSTLAKVVENMENTPDVYILFGRVQLTPHDHPHTQIDADSPSI